MTLHLSNYVNELKNDLIDIKNGIYDNECDGAYFDGYLSAIHDVEELLKNKLLHYLTIKDE